MIFDKNVSKVPIIGVGMITTKLYVECFRHLLENINIQLFQLQIKYILISSANINKQ